MSDKLIPETLFRNALPFWSDISADEKDFIYRNSHIISYKKGASVHDGNECSGVIIVKSGCLRVYMLSDKGKEITLYRLYSGDLCMLSASCVIQAITFDVMINAEEDCECCVINGKAFEELSERNPKIKIFALETAVNRFSDVMWVMQQILFMSTDKRLAIFLYDESVRTGSKHIEITHEQIARYIGTAREVVSRMLKYFTAEGIIETSRKGINILDKEKLKKLTL